MFLPSKKTIKDVGDFYTSNKKLEPIKDNQPDDFEPIKKMFADRIKEIKETQNKGENSNFRQYPPSGALFPKTGGKIDYSGQIDISEGVLRPCAQYKKNKKAMEENNLSLEQVPYLKASLVGWRKMGKKSAFIIVTNKYVM